MPELSDTIQACRKGEKSAQCLIYEQYSPKMRALCYRYLKSKEDVEDVLHDSFLWIFTRIHQYKGTGSFEGWIRRIFIGNAINFIKAKKQIDFSYDHFDFIQMHKQNPVLSREKNDNSSPYQNMFSVEISEREVFDILQKLPEGYRMVFNLYVFEKYSHKEIANILGISIGTSKSQLSKARKYLQRELFELSEKKRNTEAQNEYRDFLRVVC